MKVNLVVIESEKDKVLKAISRVKGAKKALRGAVIEPAVYHFGWDGEDQPAVRIQYELN